MKKCAYCSIKNGHHELKDWSNSDVILYYCEDHIQQAKLQSIAEEERFYEYYKEESTRSWLQGRNLLLWESIHLKKKKKFFGS